jgi:hypothetical protein
VTCSAEEAKAELGLPVDEFAFVSIGFIQHHKGFDRSVEAFSLARLPHASLHVVGSGRIDHAEIGSYVAELTEMCAATDGVELHNRFVSDDQFDLWIQASDAVVLPYRQIWSSSVVERARLFDKPIIASDLEQLQHQLGDTGFACPDTGQMAVAMEKVWSSSPLARLAPEDQAQRRRSTDHVSSAAWDVDDTTPDRHAIQTQIARRAGTSSAGHAGGTPPVRTESGPRTAIARSSPAARLSALGPVDRPEPVSARPGVAPVKQAVQRATGWQVEPLYQRIRDLQQATLEAVVEMESRLDGLAAEAAKSDAMVSDGGAVSGGRAVSGGGAVSDGETASDG